MRLETDAIPSPGGTDAAMAVAPKPSINLAHLPLDEQLEQFKSILRQNETLIKVLEGAAQLNLPNWYLAAGQSLSYHVSLSSHIISPHITPHHARLTIS